MAADSFGEENYQIFRHGNLLARCSTRPITPTGPSFNNAYRTFTFDMASGRRVQLADLTTGSIR